MQEARHQKEEVVSFMKGVLASISVKRLHDMLHIHSLASQARISSPGGVGQWVPSGDQWVRSASWPLQMPKSNRY
jgi:hypothetical protein